MYLKRLELTGFKSFPEKIKLEFNKGITAVVGPNGSGKSNISDAVRWVLGEQSAKNLRGAKMEDVIFAGTENRRPLSFAEVALTIDNEDKALNIDYSEITIKRRVYRSGESEYQLNGTVCRLKDIHEMFMDTGIGKEGYSIVGQGKIEEVLSSKGEDRRLLFEEAAGIVKYKARRYEALNKLEKERQNILRVEDILFEIEDKIGPLEEQAKTAKKYMLLAEELKLTQVNIFVNEVEGFSEKIKDVDNDISNTTIQISEQNKIKEEINLEIGDLKQKEEYCEAKIQETSNLLSDLRSNTEQTENDIVLSREKINHILSNIESIEKFIQSANFSISENKKILSSIHNERASHMNQLKSLKKELDEKSKEFEGFSSIMTEEEEKIEAFNANIIENMNLLSDIKGEIQKTEGLYEQLELRKESLSSEKSRTLSALKEQEKNKLEFEKEINSGESRILNIKRILETLSKEKIDLNQNKNLSKNELSKTNNALQALTSRLKVLSELECNYEGYYKSVKNILVHKKNNKNELKGVIGAVGEILKVKEGYETAIEIALSASVQNIITETEEDAKEAISFLKRSNSGRATFLPLTAIKPSSKIANKSILEESGVVGIAKDLVEYDLRFENVFSSLLERVIVVDHIDTGIRLSKKYKNAFKIVSIQGDLFNIGGSITGGSINQNSGGIFTRNREISDLKDKIKSLQSSEEKLNNTLISINKQLDAIFIQEEENKNSLHSIEIEMNSLSHKLSQAEENILSLNNSLNALIIEDKSIMDKIIEVNHAIRDKNQSKELIEEKINSIKDEIAQIQKSVSIRKLEKDERLSKITDLKVEISSIEEKIKSFDDNIKRIETDLSESEASIVKNEKDEEDKRLIIKEKETEILNLGEKIKELRENHASLSNELTLLQENKQSLKLKIEESEKNLMEQSEVLSNLKSELSRLEMKKEHINEQLRALYDNMWDNYEITYNQASKYERLDYSLNKLQSNERRLKAEIKSLGNVNIGAIEEYQLLKERYDFLTVQRNDILDAEEKLKDIIAKLSALMEERFASHFKIISDNFNTVFKEMFGGGKAYLRLTDEDNLLESGIEIIAQPPGKNLQNLSLLSGGERSLTAIALLFAIFKMKPSPFCILDEIEAALDDANVYKYADYIRTLQKNQDNTQFILITHRKAVMENADVLYGITMQEQGISKLVSVRLEDNIATTA